MLCCVIIGGETPNISINFNTVVEERKENTFRNHFQSFLRHQEGQLSDDVGSLGQLLDEAFVLLVTIQVMFPGHHIVHNNS